MQPETKETEAGKANPQGPDAKAIIQRHDKLKARRSSWDVLWQDIANYVQPRKSEILEKKEPGTEEFSDDLFNTTAVSANQVLAAGMMDYLFSGRWMEYAPRPELGDDEDLKNWYQRATEIIMSYLALSNFYEEVHEHCLDRGGFGTASLFIDEDETGESLFVFCNEDVGSFSLDENSRKRIDTRFREFRLSARQAVQKFGLSNLGEKCRRAYTEEGGRKRDDLFTFIHAIYPRSEDERDPAKADGKNKPIASIYVCKEDEHVCRNAGYDEMPVAATRYARWGSAPYGYSPSIIALPTTRQVNHIERQMDALAEQHANPRVLLPENMVDEVDLAPGGVTVYDPNVGQAKPEEWVTAGKYDIGLQRVEAKERAIKEAYHNDLFEMLKVIERQMTAFEVAQRVAEKVAMFSPTFRRMDSEFFQPVMKRLFAIAYRAGVLGEAPASAFVPTTDGTARLAMPVVTLTSKLAMASKEAENNEFLKVIQLLMPLASLKPEIIDNLNIDKAARGIARHKLPQEWQNSEREVEEIRAARNREAARVQRLANAESAARAAKDASAASPEMQKAAVAASAA